MICPKYNAFSFLIFRTNLFSATRSETNCSYLLSVAGISVTVVADVYSVESSAYIDTLVLLKASGMSLVKIEKSRGPKQLPGGIPDSTWILLERLPLKNTLYVLLDR
jgi:hypothetical protein